MKHIAESLLLLTLYLSFIGAGMYLVITEHYGWAWIPWLALFCVRRTPSSSCEVEHGK
jgi:hypothetical protein